MRNRSQSSSTWFDVFEFVSLAAGLGLAAGIALGALALLLAAPAYGAAPERTTEGVLILRAADGESIAAPLVSTDVVFRVSGPVARARVVQTFHNPQDAWLEAVYVFPLPERAAVDALRMKVGERVAEGIVQEREEARRTYTAARAGGLRAALFDQERPNLFTTQLANVGPHESVVVELEYQQTLRYDGNRYSLRFPMVVGPRYSPPGALRVADAERVSPPVLRPGQENGRTNPVTLRVELDAGLPISRLHSAHHSVHVEEPSASRRVVTLAHGAVRADRDFELAWSPAEADLPQVAWFGEEKDGRHYGLLVVHPPATAQSARLPREVVFVLDTSGSMAGASIRQAREALSLALGRLAPGDRFNVIEFNSTARALFDGAREADSGAVRRALRWVGSLEARGGTEMAAALRLAFPPDPEDERLRQVVFLTDGAVGNEEALFRIIRLRLGSSRLFTVGIGSAPNSHFMTKAAQLGRGTFTYIGRIDEVSARMGELFAKLETPVLKNLKVSWPEGSAAESWPPRIPDLYAGEPLVLTVALGRLGGEAQIAGERDGRIWRARVPLVHRAAHSGMGALWARDKVAALLDLVREGASEPEIRSQVVALATAHRLVTRYTSFVAVDRTPARDGSADLTLRRVPTLLPAGWEYAKVFGELPQGSTDSRLKLLTGGLLLILGFLLLLGRRKFA